MILTSEYITNINTIYDELLKKEDPKKIWPSVMKRLESWPEIVFETCSPPLDPTLVDIFLPEIVKIAQLIFIDINCSGNEERREKLTNLLEVTEKLIECGGEKAKKIATAFLESLIVGLEALSLENSDQIIDKLSDIIDMDIGGPPRLSKYNLNKNKPHKPAHLYDLLNAALYTEVIGFCQERRLKDAVKKNKSLVQNIKCPVITVTSRKGGTGKSTFLMGVACWFLKKKPKARICVLDFDLSGPVWQYLLFPVRGKPQNFLNDLLNSRQPEDVFDFGKPTKDDVYALAEAAPVPFIDKIVDICHIGVHDLPRTNKQIDSAVYANRGKFYSFLVRIVSYLSQKYDLILIDNSPGFHSIPYCSLVLAGNAPLGLPVVLSTPVFWDVGGTFLELSDIRLLNFVRPPIWVINKSTESSWRFFQKERTAIKIAQDLKAYDGVLPDVPLVAKLANPSTPWNVWKCLMMDESLLTFAYVGDDILKLSESTYASEIYTLMDEQLDKRIGESV